MGCAAQATKYLCWTAHILDYRWKVSRSKLKNRLNRPQKHPERIRTQRQWGQSSLFLSFSSNLRNQVELLYTKSYKSHPKLGPPVNLGGVLSSVLSPVMRYSSDVHTPTGCKFTLNRLYSFIYYAISLSLLVRCSMSLGSIRRWVVPLACRINKYQLLSLYVPLLQNVRYNTNCIHGWLYLFVSIECGAVQRDSNGAFLFMRPSPMSSSPCEWIVGSQTTVEVIVIIERISRYVSLCEKAEIHFGFCSRLKKYVTWSTPTLSRVQNYRCFPFLFTTSVNYIYIYKGITLSYKLACYIRKFQLNFFPKVSDFFVRTLNFRH